jgi:hypothetical protein
MRRSLLPWLVLGILVCIPPQVFAAPAFEVSERQVRISAGVLERVISFADGNWSTIRLRVNGQDLLAGPAAEVSLIVTRAEPNARPRGLKPGEGGSIDSVQTFRPGQHVDPGTYDDATLGQTTRWVEPIRIRASQWANNFARATPEVSTPSADVSRLSVRAVAPGESPLDGLTISVIYEVYRDEPVVRKWVEITNEGSVWRKIEQLTIDDFALAPSLSERVPLTPAGYGVGTSMIGFASSDGTFGVIVANEIPSGMRTIADTGALGYHPARFEWVLGPGEKFVSEPVFLYAFAGPVQQTISARSTPLDRTVEDPFQHFVSLHVGIVGERMRCAAPQWLTWANFGPNLDDAIIRRQADCAARAGFVQFLIDDGWQRDRLGTEPDRVKFPDFAATADYIRSRGLELGLWLSCFRDTNSPDRQAMPDARSLPEVTRLGGIAMSFTTPWREYYAQDLARLHERYGAAYFKQDFSNILYGDLAENHPNRTRKESLLRGLRGLLEAQDRLRALAPDVMNELTHEIYWDTPGAPCDLAALKHAARYHVSPNACRGIVPRPKPGQKAPAVDPQKLRGELISACYQARQIFYSHRGLPLYCLEFYGAATEDHQGSLTPEVQDRQVVSWLMGAPLVFSGDLSTLSAEHLAHYRQRFALVNRLHRSWDIYHHFQFSGVPAPNDDDWHWWGKLNDEGCGAVVVVRGSGGAERRAINIPWVKPDRTYEVIASFGAQRLGTFTGRQLQSAGVEMTLPVYGQEILELTPARRAENTIPDVRVLHLPEGALVPDVMMDGAGVLHMVYGLGDDAWYVRSADNGRTFSAPVKVNTEGKVTLKMGERGPKLALGKGGSIHVVWADQWSPGVKVYPRYSRSLDGGKTFEPPRALASLFGIDGLTVAADGQGTVVAFFHHVIPGQPLEVPESHRLYLARSTDNGATFGPEERLRIQGMDDLACSMCMMRARMTADGNVNLALRVANDNIRDFFLLRSPKRENTFVPLRVNEDRWELTKCPMCGPELTLDPGERMLCAFMSRHRVYWSALDEGRFQLHVATPAHENDEIYPAACSDGKEHVLLVWQAGPMAVGRQATVKWALYRSDGAFTGKQGTIGVSTSGTKATAFVGTDGAFYIVTTAK